MPTQLENEKSNFLNSLANGLAVLTTFDAQSPSLTISEVASRTNLTRASARRILLTLADLGFVSQRGSSYSLTPRALSIGHSYLNASGIEDAVAHHVAALSRELQESVSVAVLDGDEIVYVARSAAKKIMQVRISIGTRFAAASTSMGRVMLAAKSDAEIESILSNRPLERLTQNTMTDKAEVLAEIQRVRGQGYAVVNQELEVGLKSIAVPILNANGVVIAALNVAGVATENSQRVDLRILEALKDCALKITTELGMRPGL